MAKSKETDATKEAREQSLATLSEQENMKPVPSQEDADRIKIGEEVEANEKQPDGPAAESAERTAKANEETLAKSETAAQQGSYKTRASKAG